MTNEPSDDRLERQVERASLFTHTELSRCFTHIDELGGFLYGLVDVLAAKGVLSPEELAEAAARVTAEQDAAAERPTLAAALRVDPPEEEAPPPTLVNCAERMPVCHAVCCTLDFALSDEEVESGRVKWDLGRPYFIRHEADGHCAHWDPATTGCGIYDHRPSVCRNYSCAGDERIWKDFDNMVINEEWIAEHSGPERPILLKTTMRRLPVSPTEGPAPDEDDADKEGPRSRMPDPAPATDR
jgi:Fe-S-cluster containining protein